MRSVLAAVGVAFALGPGAALAEARVSGILNPPGANGPSDHASFSQDNRDVRLIAYDSAATNLVPGDTNGRRDVFVLRRTGPLGTLDGRLSRVSVTNRGAQANGDSDSPSVDGTSGERPHCIAFESRATNLARGDHSADLDVYLRDLRRRTTSLVSVGLRVDASHATIDGFCRYVAFESGVRVLVRDLRAGRMVRISRGENPDIQTDGKGITYDRAGQVYYLRLHAGRPRGRELLVSDTRTGSPGNGASTNPVVDDHGRHVAFESTATDLCTARCDFPPLYSWQEPDEHPNDPAASPIGDANRAISDIYRRTIGVPSGDSEAMVNASYDANFGQANAPSHHPAISRAGDEIVFESAATNRIGGGDRVTDPGGLPSLFFWYWSSQRTSPAGRLRRGVTWFDPNPQVYRTVIAASTNPAMSSRGNYIGFTSVGTGEFGEANGPGIADVFAVFGAPGSEAP